MMIANVDTSHCVSISDLRHLFLSCQDEIDRIFDRTIWGDPGMHSTVVKEGVGNCQRVSSTEVDKSYSTGVVASSVVVMLSYHFGVQMVDSPYFGVKITEDEKVISI